MSDMYRLVGTYTYSCRKALYFLTFTLLLVDWYLDVEIRSDQICVDLIIHFLSINQSINMLGRGSGSGSGSLMSLPLLLLLWLQTLLLLPGVEATWTAYQEYLSGLDSTSSSSSSSPEQQQRHEITFSPNSPWKSIAAVTTAGQRNQTCVVESHGDFVTDDSAAIVDAVKKCNPGGKVVFPEGKTYVVGKAMDLTGLRGMDIGMFFCQSSFLGAGGFQIADT